MKWSVPLMLVILLAAAACLGGTTGKIRGLIKDRESGEALVSANVALIGTQLGASSSVEGEYVIMNVPPGLYALRFTMVGYTPVTVQNVRVVVDQTTTIDAELSSSAVQMADMVIEAERPLVQRDKTATTAVVSSEQIQQLPVRNFAEIIQLQAGVTGEGRTIHVRGGRSDEAVIMIDGVYVRNPVLGSTNTALNNEAIAELNLLSGTFSAEYGNAMSGVVNLVTKEGGAKFSGSLEGRTSEFGVKEQTDLHENRVGGTFSGPIVDENLTFFLSGERDARGSWLPYGYDNTISGIAKVSARLVPELKATLTGRYSENRRQGYNHDWKYIPDQYLLVKEFSRQAIAGVTHTAATNLFYDLRVSYLSSSYRSGLNKDTSQYISLDQRRYLLDVGTGREFWAVADPLELIENSVETFDLKGDLVWQLGANNEIKTGIQLKKHSLQYVNIYDPKRTYPYITDFSQSPVEAAVYVKDKLELESFVLDFGLRVDYMNQRAPYRQDPLDTTSVVNSTAKTQVSPRFGIAHPVTDRTSLYFSYGHFFQIPTYDRFYENSQYDFNVREPLIGNPDLNAMKTIAYEVGITHQFSSTFAGSFTAMYKDVTGLIGTQYYPPYVGGRYVGYTLYVNDSYANVRGFEVSLTMRRTGYVAGSLSYTYQVARGNASSETEDYPAVTPSTQLAPLDWDRTHVLNANVNLVFLDNDGPEVFGGKVLENSSWSLLLRAGTGYPYTPSGRDIGLVPKNSARMPGDYSLDFLATKEWIIRPVTVGIFLEVLNLTDARNVRYVYPDTGEPDVTNEGVHSAEWMADPSNYGPPRRIHLGARLRF